MAKHEITYDKDGCATTDGWSLDEYLHADGLSLSARDTVRESVLSWLREFHNADCGIIAAIEELKEYVGSDGRPAPVCLGCGSGLPGFFDEYQYYDKTTEKVTRPLCQGCYQTRCNAEPQT